MSKITNTRVSLRLIFWEITQACNLGCPHCRAQAQSGRSPSELDLDEARCVIKQVASFSKPILVFSGGEPLLRDDIYELIRYATASGLKTAIATNATLITEDVAEKLKDNGIGIAAVSIYGADAESHDRFCGREGAFKKSLRGIENLKKTEIPFQINTTITKKNLAELEAIGDFALEQGAIAYHLFYLVPTGRGRYIEGDKISPHEYEVAFNNLYDLQQNLPLRIKATCAPHYYRVLKQRSMRDVPSPHPLPAEEKERGRFDGFGAVTKGCLAGQDVCFISHKGEVYGCGYLPIIAGDLRGEDFEKIWNESELFSILRDDSKLQGKCGICEFKKLCGGCRARAYAACGNYLEEEPECVYQPLSVRS